MIEHDIEHRDAFDSLARMRDLGGVRLIVTSPPYPDARTPEQYGGACFDTTLAGYGRLGDAVREALMPGGVCALNIDGPIRVWRPELGESERSLIAFEVAIDWARRVGLRYIEHGAKVADARPGIFGPRWRAGWEPVHIFSRPGAEPWFDNRGYTLRSQRPGRAYGPGRARRGDGWMSDGGGFVQQETRCLSTAFQTNNSLTDRDHPAPFAPDIADAYVLCYSRPGELVGDPFVGSGTVAESCNRHGRRFVGGDLGHRERDSRRWADIVRERVAQRGLFEGLDEHA